MTSDGELLTTPLECPLCHDTFGEGEAFDRHLRADHSKDDLVAFVYAYLDERDQNEWG